MKTFKLLFIIVFILSFSANLVAQNNDKVDKISKNLRCLVCQGQSIADSNSDPEPIDYIIPGNDDAIRSINLYANYFKATLSDARELSKNIAKEKMDEEKEKKEK